jgi:SAM-dependent methyltransferase
MPTAALLDQYYSQYYAHADGTELVTMDDASSLVRRIERHRSAFGPTVVSRVLDFGGGDGTISRALAARFVPAGAPHVEVVVVDHGGELVVATGGVSMRRVADLTEVAGPFDVVLASAVLEHLPQPMETLESLAARLAPGGLLYVRTPAVSSLIALAARLRITIDFTYPGHVHDLGQSFWEGVDRWWEPVRSGVLRQVASRPSPVETSFRRHAARTAVAHIVKAPWWVVRRGYPFVGGWEAVFVKRG